MPVVEADFLLGLREKDKKYKICSAILGIAKASDELCICGSAFIELGIGLRGNLKRVELIETIQNLYALTHFIKEIPLSPRILIAGLEIEQKLELSNLYDCLHAATAISHDSIIVSDDSFYDNVSGLTRISLSEFAKRH